MDDNTMSFNDLKAVLLRRKWALLLPMGGHFLAGCSPGLSAAVDLSFHGHDPYRRAGNTKQYCPDNGD